MTFDSLAVRGRRRRAALVLFLVMLPATLLLYGGTLTGWWCCDDSQLLKFAIRYSPWQYFAVPEVWREAVISSLTPLEVLAYDIDHALFGTWAAGFYAHNLLAIALTAWTVYLAARQWVDRPGPAVAAGLLFLAGSPVAMGSEQLMGRHYIEGLAAYLLSVVLFVRAAREQRPGLAAWAALAYAVAASAKEIFLPLGLVPFLLPVGPARRRLALGWPFLLVMLLYIPWRAYMLGHAFGGYQPAGSWASLETLRAVALQLMGVPGRMLTGWGTALGAAALAAALWAAPARQRWPVLLGAGLVFGLLLAPLLALARYPGLNAYRYFLTLWTAFALVVPVGLARLGAAGLGEGSGLGAVGDRRGPGRPWLRAAPLAVAALLGLSAWVTTGRMLEVWRPAAVEHAVQGRALASAGADAVVYLTPTAAGWSASGLIDLRPAMGRPDTPPLMVGDEIELAALPRLGGPGGMKVLRYDYGRQQMADVAPEVPAQLAQWRGKLARMPLDLLFEYDHASQTVRWRMAQGEGAPAGGRLTYLGSYLGQIGRVEVPLQSAMRIPPSYVDACFRFRYDAPGGGIAYTPPLSLPPPDAQGVSRLRWQGVFEPADAARAGCAIRAQR